MINLITISSDLVKDVENCFTAYRKSNKKPALSYSTFLDTFLPYLRSHSDVSYPRIIKVAKPIEDLIVGDLEPAYELTISAPITYNGREIWLGDSSKKIDLHFGYQNNDKRYLSEYAFDDSTHPHGFLGGSTGSGKSVCLNQLLFNLFMEYAPWELDVTLSDAKIVEFKAYGLQHHIPHIHSISATEDPLYLVSVIRKFHKDMKLMNSVLTQVGAKNLEEFRKVTGLTVARHLLVMDEVTAMFRSLPNDIKVEMIKLLSDIGALGRNTGYNILLASQNVDNSVSEFIEHLAVRMCLKCNQANISNKILGNDQGAIGDVGTGKIYVNNNTASGSKDDNTKFRVPYLSPDEFSSIGKFLEEKGREVGYKSSVSFYNEHDKIMEDRLVRMCDVKRHSPSLVLGEPSFISDEPDSLEIEFDNEDITNVLVYAPLAQDLHRYFRTFYNNALSDKRNSRKIDHRFLMADRSLLKAPSLAKNLKDIDPQSDGFAEQQLKSTEGVWDLLKIQAYTESLLVTADERAFRDVQSSEDSINFYKKYVVDEEMSDVTKSRIFWLLKLSDDPSFAVPLGLKELIGTNREQHLVRIIRLAFKILKSLGSEYIYTKVVKESLPFIVYHVVGAHRVNGLGRDATMTQMNKIKKYFQDCHDANVVFIVYSSSIDTLSDALAGFKYCILDKIKDPMRVKCSSYPAQVQDVCGVLFKIIGDEVKTFKRLSLTIAD